MAQSIVFDATLASPEANSYVTLAEADSYLSARYGAEEWLNIAGEASEIQAIKERLLATASRHLDLQAFLHGQFSAAYGWPRQQAMKLPWSRHEYITGPADGGTETTLVDESLSGRDIYPDDIFKGGSFYIYKGANQFEIRRVGAFESATGTVTLATELDEPVDETCLYYLLYPLAHSVRASVCEQALYLLGGANFELLNERQKGIRSHSVGGTENLNVSIGYAGRRGMLCAQAYFLLESMLRRAVAIQRA